MLVGKGLQVDISNNVSAMLWTKKLSITKGYNNSYIMQKRTTKSEYDFVKTFNVVHDEKWYRVSQGITGSWKMQFFSIISFLNDLRLYDE